MKSSLIYILYTLC